MKYSLEKKKMLKNRERKNNQYEIIKLSTIKTIHSMKIDIDENPQSSNQFSTKNPTKQLNYKI